MKRALRLCEMDGRDGEMLVAKGIIVNQIIFMFD
jgi:hypothetical protein